MLAVVHCLTVWEHYLKAVTPFKIKMDNKVMSYHKRCPLSSTNNIAQARGQRAMCVGIASISAIVTFFEDVSPHVSSIWYINMLPFSTENSILKPESFRLSFIG